MEIIVTDQNFSELVASGKPFVVDFSATWCGPCKKLAPTVAELAEEYDGKALVGKCDVDDSEALAAKFGIRSVPTVLFFKAGEAQPSDKSVGAVSKQVLADKLNALF